jgi:hypothetical protein
MVSKHLPNGIPHAMLGKPYCSQSHTQQPNSRTPRSAERAPLQGPGTITASVCPGESWILSDFGGHPAKWPKVRAMSRPERPSAEMNRERNRVNRFDDTARGITGGVRLPGRASGCVRPAVLHGSAVRGVVVPVPFYSHPISSTNGSSGSRTKISIIRTSPPVPVITRGVPFSPGGPRSFRNRFQSRRMRGDRPRLPVDAFGEKCVHVNVHTVSGVH